MAGCVPDAAWWSARRVFVTGHTGFVGGWLCTWLAKMGAQVHGYSLPPNTDPSFFAATGLGQRIAASTLADLNDAAALAGAIGSCEPQVVFHLAAQPLVREAWRSPVATFATNVMGTVQLLEACRGRDSLEKLVVYTTDKVYRNDQSGRALAEGDRLGGNEPYSASKAGAECAVAAYWESYFRATPLALAIVRAGNILGGGDWAAERLLPDAMRAFGRAEALVLRNPASTRPWQHVLDAVRGTLVLAERATAGDFPTEDLAWNFGPPAAEVRTVGDIATIAAHAWGEGASWRHEPDAAITESRALVLASDRARQRLGWQCLWDAERAVRESVAWYREARAAGDVHARTERQIEMHATEALGAPA